MAFSDMLLALSYCPPIIALLFFDRRQWVGRRWMCTDRRFRRPLEQVSHAGTRFYFAFKSILAHPHGPGHT